MKKFILSLMATGVAGMLVSATAQPAGEDNNNANATPPADMPPPDMGPPPDAAMPPDAAQAAQPNGDSTSASQVREPLVITPSKTRATQPDAAPSAFLPPTQAGTNGSDLNMDFKSAPLDLVLNYLSDAAGFIVVQDTHISSTATVTINGKHLTRDEVVNLLNSVLNKNGYAVIRDGRTLTVVDKNDAKTREIPVKSGNNPDDIPKNAEIVTQIIPIRFVEARQLVSDLSSFVSPQATVVANEAGNSLVITDTQANIRHLAEIIRAIDNAAEAETEIRVFPLKYASPTDVATELGSVFPSSSSGNSSQSPIRFGGGPGGGGGGPGGFFARMMAANSGSGSSANDRVKKATAVSAVADARIQAVIVTAPKDLMEEISSVIKSIDVQSDRDQNVYVFRMNNGDAQQAAQVLQNMFQSSSARSSSGSSQNSALQQRAQNNVTQQSSSSSSSTGFGSGGGGGGGSRLGLGN